MWTGLHPQMSVTMSQLPSLSQSCLGQQRVTWAEHQEPWVPVLALPTIVNHLSASVSSTVKWDQGPLGSNEAVPADTLHV